MQDKHSVTGRSTNSGQVTLGTQRAIPKILRYFSIVIVLLINQKDYEHFIKVWIFV
jgi:hypothetical protein